MSEDVYVKLREFLDRLPGGYPATDSRVELKILRKLFTPEDARIVPLLKTDPEPASAIAPRLGLGVREAEAKLESLAHRRLILRVRQGDQKSYAAVQYLVGFWEFQLPTLNRENLALEDEYFWQYLLKHKTTQTGQIRVIPVGAALDWASDISTYDNIRELVKKKSLISLQECICRKAEGLRGSGCERPSERCLAFDDLAQFAIDEGVGRAISQDELADLLKMGEEQALVPSPNYAQDLSFLCMCCGCCCMHLRAIKMAPRPADQVRSPFLAKIDPEGCTACGVCLERCQMDAIKEDGRVYAVDEARCIGCGLCIAKCPDQAISLLPKPARAPLPADIYETGRWIMREQGTA